MPILTSILSIIPSVANDSIATHRKEILTQLSQMSLEQVFEKIVSSAVELILKVIIAFIIFFVGRWLIGRLHKIVCRILEKRKVELSLRTFLLSSINISLTLFLIVVIIGVLGIDTTSFVAVFASAGLAVGMALSGTLQNFAGGVMILLFKPYKVGDFIEAQGQSGTVKEIQIFNTILNTVDNKTIIIPNGGLSTGIINNYSKEGRRRVDWTFGIAYGDSYDQAKSILLSLLKNDNRVLNDPPIFIALHSLGDSSVNIVVRVWVKIEDFWDVYFDLNEKVYKAFASAGINIPFPQMDVHLFKGDTESL